MAIRRPPTTFSDTISTADIADDAITTAKVADDQITGALLANDIAISTTGNIATTGSGTLTVAGNTTLSGTNNLGSNPTITLGSNATVNTQDYCSVRVSALQTLSHDTYVAANLDSIEHDPNNWFSTSTKKFTPTKAGKYFVNFIAGIYANEGIAQNQISRSLIKKNATDANSSSIVTMATLDLRNERAYNLTCNCTGFVDMNGSTDYLYMMVYFVDYAGNNTGRLDQNSSQLSAFRIGS